MKIMYPCEDLRPEDRLPVDLAPRMEYGGIHQIDTIRRGGILLFQKSLKFRDLCMVCLQLKPYSLKVWLVVNLERVCTQSVNDCHAIRNEALIKLKSEWSEGNCDEK